MRIIKLSPDNLEIPFFFGLAINQKLPKPKDSLTLFLEWKKQAMANGLDVSEITYDIWRSTDAAKDDSDPWRIYYLCYEEGCKRSNKTVMTYEEFIEEIDKDFENNIKLLGDTLKELSGGKKDSSEQKNG